METWNGSFLLFQLLKGGFFGKIKLASMGDRLMVGPQPLELIVMVRIHVPQPSFAKAIRRYYVAME